MSALGGKRTFAKRKRARLLLLACCLPSQLLEHDAGISNTRFSDATISSNEVIFTVDHGLHNLVLALVQTGLSGLTWKSRKLSLGESRFEGCSVLPVEIHRSS